MTGIWWDGKANSSLLVAISVSISSVPFSSLIFLFSLSFSSTVLVTLLLDLSIDWWFSASVVFVVSIVLLDSSATSAVSACGCCAFSAVSSLSVSGTTVSTWVASSVDAFSVDDLSSVVDSSLVVASCVVSSTVVASVVASSCGCSAVVSEVPITLVSSTFDDVVSFADASSTGSVDLPSAFSSYACFWITFSDANASCVGKPKNISVPISIEHVPTVYLRILNFCNFRCLSISKPLYYKFP